MEDKESIAFKNYNCAALIEDSSGATITFDTGSSSHMTSQKELLKNYLKISSPRKIWVTDRGTSMSLGVSLMILTTNINGKLVDINLKNTLYVPDIAFTLISIGRCNDASFHAEFTYKKCVIKFSAGKILLQAPKLHGLYRIDHEPVE